IRILEDGTIKIMDFGIAKSMVSQSTLTQTGITLGTASYLAPEQIRGEAVDPRTDIFSLGVLAYELLTGQKPFTGDHISTVLYKILNETPTHPHELDAQISAPIGDTVMQAIEKDRTKRPASCADFREALVKGLPEGADEMPMTVKPSGMYPTVPVELEETISTPTGGVAQAKALSTPSGAGASASMSKAAAAASRALSLESKEITPPTPAPAGSGSVGDVHIRQEEPAPLSAAIPKKSEGPAVGVFVA